jgi:hypothetical protein
MAREGRKWAEQEWTGERHDERDDGEVIFAGGLNRKTTQNRDLGTGEGAGEEGDEVCIGQRGEYVYARWCTRAHGHYLKASPGNLQAVEEMLFSSSDITTAPMVMAVKIASSGSAPGAASAKGTYFLISILTHPRIPLGSFPPVLAYES